MGESAAEAAEGHAMGERVKAAMRFKKALTDRGLDRGKGKCPYCEAGRWHGYIVGRRKHLHVRCDGCNFSMME